VGRLTWQSSQEAYKSPFSATGPSLGYWGQQDYHSLFKTWQFAWPTAHTVNVITVHWGSVGCLQPTPSSEWFLKGPHLISPFTQWAAFSPHLLLSDSSKPAPYFTLSLSDSSKPAPYFTVISVKRNWSRIQSKNLVHIRIQSKNACLRRNLFHKFCLRRNFFIKNLETVCLRLSVPLSKIGTRTGASPSSIRKDRN